MTINWPLIIVLFCISIPGVVIAIKRLIYFLLPSNSEALKKRIGRFAIFQTLFMVFILTFAGAILAPKTGLHDKILEALLQGSAGINAFYPIVLPVLLYACFGILIFCAIYYGMITHIVDKKDVEIMGRIRATIGIDGCVLYGGVVEEVVARWGLVNLTAFFALLFSKQNSNLIIWIAIIMSGLIFAIGQLPAYFAAGCSSNRRFIYSLIALSLYQSILFGYVFWQYGILAAILAHMLFHLGWAAIEGVKKV